MFEAGLQVSATEGQPTIGIGSELREFLQMSRATGIEGSSAPVGNSGVGVGQIGLMGRIGLIGLLVKATE